MTSITIVLASAMVAGTAKMENMQQNNVVGVQQMAQHSGEMLHSSSHEAVTYIPAATARVVVTGLVLEKE